MDSAGRLGLWPPNNEILKRVLLLGGVKVADANVAADSLLDWIDEDDLKHLNGAEKYFYRSENSLGFEPRNNRFIQSVEELELIRGFRGKAYDLVREELLDTAPGILNINTADALVLAAALDVDLESAQRLVQVREKKGIVTYVDLVGLTGKGLTFMDEYITTIPSMTLDVDIRTRFNEAGDSVRALVRFKSERDRPFTVEKYQE
jgi:type II secretory pathway component PulK